MMRRSKIITLVGSLLLLMNVLGAESSKTGGWEIETLEQAGKGMFSSLQVDKDGNAHVVYSVNQGHFLLTYSFWDHKLKRWFSMPLAMDGSFCTLVLDSHQHPHVSWVKNGASRGNMLWHSYWNGEEWKHQAIPINAEVIGFFSSIALDLKDNPTISFYEYEGPKDSGLWLRLRTATWNGTYWEVHTVDPNLGSGKFNFLIRDSKGVPNIAYGNVKYESQSLRYGRFDGNSWQYEILEGLTGPFAAYSEVALMDKDDNPHIAYTDGRKMVVKYATRRGGKWEFEEVDSIVNYAFPDRNGIALDPAGNPYISYYDSGLGILKLARKKGKKWLTEIVDQNFSGLHSSIQIADDYIWLTYADEGGNGLKFARRPLDERIASGQSGTPASAAPNK